MDRSIVHWETECQTVLRLCPWLERWRPVVGYEGYYEVSDWGRVRSLDRLIEGPGAQGSIAVQHRRKGKLKRLSQDWDGYKLTSLCKEGVERQKRVHILVAEAFLAPRPEWSTMVNHKNGNTANNILSNLEWSNNGHNKRHALGQRKYLYEGKMVSCAELAEIAGIAYQTMHGRLNQSGMSPEQAVNFRRG